MRAVRGPDGSSRGAAWPQRRANPANGPIARSATPVASVRWPGRVGQDARLLSRSMISSVVFAEPGENARDAVGVRLGQRSGALHDLGTGMDGRRTNPWRLPRRRSVHARAFGHLDPSMASAREPIMPSEPYSANSRITLFVQSLEKAMTSSSLNGLGYLPFAQAGGQLLFHFA
jgi:hypothetical protein